MANDFLQRDPSTGVPTWGAGSSGAVSSVNGRTGAVVGLVEALADAGVKTGAYTAAANQIVRADATSAGFTVTLPTTPADATRVTVKKIDTSANVVTVTRGGSDVFNKTGGSTSLTLTYSNASLGLQYVASGGIWVVVSTDAGAGVVHDSRQILTSGGLTGGGDLTADRTLSVASIPAWAATTAYIAGQLVQSPVGAYVTGVRSLIQATTSFTSGSSFSASNWTQLADIQARVNSVLAAGSASNTTADTTLSTASTIPASTLVAGVSMIRIDLDGNFDSIISGGIFNHKLKVGSTVVLTNQIAGSQTSAATALGWKISARVYIDTVGASGGITIVYDVISRSAAGATTTASSSVVVTGLDLSAGFTAASVASMATANAGNVTRLVRGAVVQAI